jgi:hypothetical protein
MQSSTVKSKCFLDWAKTNLYKTFLSNLFPYHASSLQSLPLVSDQIYCYGGTNKGAFSRDR